MSIRKSIPCSSLPHRVDLFVGTATRSLPWPLSPVPIPKVDGSFAPERMMPMSQSEDELRAHSGYKYEQLRQASCKLDWCPAAFSRSDCPENGRPRLAACQHVRQVDVKECR